MLALLSVKERERERGTWVWDEISLQNPHPTFVGKVFLVTQIHHFVNVKLCWPLRLRIIPYLKDHNWHITSLLSTEGTDLCHCDALATTRWKGNIQAQCASAGGHHVILDDLLIVKCQGKKDWPNGKYEDLSTTIGISDKNQKYFVYNLCRRWWIQAPWSLTVLCAPLLLASMENQYEIKQDLGR